MKSKITKKQAIADDEIFVGCVLKKTHPVDALGVVKDLELIWAEGMIGVIPVFENKKAARKYIGNKSEILVFKIKEKSSL